MSRVGKVVAQHTWNQYGDARLRLKRLTHRELEVVMLAARGLTTKDIASLLAISFRTVEAHRRNAMRKTGAGNIVELTHLVRGTWNEQSQSDHRE